MLLSTANNILYIIELTVGFETNIDHNACRKYEKYRNLIQVLSTNYHKVKCINISISSLGIFGNSCDAYIQMNKDLNCEEKHLRYILKKLITTIIRTTYYIFCMRNKPWTNPEILTYQLPLSTNTLLLILCSIVALYNYCITRQAKYKLPVVSEICICMIRL